MTLIDLLALREHVRTLAGDDWREWARAHAITVPSLHDFLGGTGMPCRNTLRAAGYKQVTRYETIAAPAGWCPQAVDGCR